VKLLRNHYLLIVLLVIVGYWQVTFFQSSLRWDMLDVHLPFLHYLSLCFQEGEFHFWNPYQQLGYPFYADLQATPYYPLALIVAKVVGFNLFVLHLYFLLHVIIAGAGMFWLCNSVSLPKNYAAVCGVCYALGGIFLSHGQHLLIITAAAYIPFALGQFILLYKSPSFIRAVSFALLIYLLLSGGYPLLSIIFCYILVILFVCIAVKRIYEKKYRELLKFAWGNLLAALLVLLFSIPLILALKEVMPEVSRGDGISLDYSLNGSYTLRAFLYFLIPFSLVKNAEFFGTHLSMANSYFGVITCCFFIYSLTRKKERAEYFFLAAGIICLLISFGQELPLRSWLYTYLPFMNYFRFPALFRIFTVVSFIVVAGFGLHKFFNHKNKNDRKSMLFIAFFVATYFFAHFLVSVFNADFSSFYLFKPHATLKDALDAYAFHEHVIMQVFIQLFFLSVFVWLILKKKQQHLKTSILLLIIADMLISAQLNINYTVTNPQLNPAEIQAGLSKQPNGFPLPERKNMASTSNERIGVTAIWRNVNVFSKEPGVDAFSSFWLNNYDLLIEQHPALATQILKNPPIYLSGNVLPESALNKKINDSLLTSKDLFVNEENYMSLSHISFSSSVNDTCYFDKFGPNEFIVSVKSSGQQILTLLQNNYKGWEVNIDNRPVKHFTSNLMFISTVVSSGEHIVTFKYDNTVVTTTFVISSVLFFIALLIVSLALLRRKNLSLKKKIIILTASLVCIALVFGYAASKRPYSEIVNEQIETIASIYKKWQEQYGQENISALFDVNNRIALEKSIHNDGQRFNTIFMTLSEPENIARLIKLLENTSTPYFAYSWANTVQLPEAMSVIRAKYPVLEESHISENAHTMLFSNKGKKHALPLFSTVNDFEKEYDGWSFPALQYDTSVYFSSHTSNKLDSSNIFSSAFSAPYKDLFKDGKITITATANAFFLDTTAFATLVLSIERNGKSVAYHTSPAHRYAGRPGNWSKVVLTRTIEDDFLPDDLVKIYVWNKGKALLYIDDFKIEILKGESYNF